MGKFIFIYSQAVHTGFSPPPSGSEIRNRSNLRQEIFSDELKINCQKNLDGWVHQNCKEELLRAPTGLRFDG
jgi:hypothetical protein